MSSSSDVNDRRIVPLIGRWVGRAVRPAWGRVQEPYVLFPLCAILLLIVGWTAVFHLINVEKLAGTRAAAESSRELADTYEAQMARNLTAIDQTLKTVKFGYELKGRDVLAQLQKSSMLPSPSVFDVAIAGADGSLIMASRPGVRGNVAAESFFQRARDEGGKGAHAIFAQLTKNAATGVTNIAFVERLQTEDGRFGGIAIVSVDPGYFTSRYDVARMGDGGLLMLIGTDGVVQARRVGQMTTWGDRVSTDAVRRAALESSDQAAVREWDDGVRRYTNVRALHGFPLIAVVGLGQGEQLALFRQHRTTYLMEAVVGSAILLVLTVIFSRTSWLLAVSRQRARQARQTYYAASENSLDAFFFLKSRVDSQDRISDFILGETNRRGVELCGLPRESLIGRSFDAAFPGFRYSGMFDALVCVAQTGRVEEHEWIHARADATFIWLHRQVVKVEEGVVAIVRDISARKWAESSRAEQNRVLEMIATSTPLTDVLSHLMLLIEAQISESQCTALMLDTENERLNLLAAPSAPEKFKCSFPMPLDGEMISPSERAIVSRRPVVIDDLMHDVRTKMRLVGADMHDYHACWAYPILSHEGIVLGTLTIHLRRTNRPNNEELQVIAMATRIAGIAIERSQAEDRIHHMATHDPLTGLPNRTLLSKRLDEMLQTARQDKCGVTVAFIDLDNFKLINDSLGHHAGDDLLKTVARRMVRCLRPGDIVVRLGGDEFVVVLYDAVRLEEGLEVAIERIRQAVIEPIQLGAHTYQVTGSMGLASYPIDGDDAESLLMNADAAMYRAKELGRNNYQYFTTEMNSRICEKLQMQDQLRQALRNNELTLLYQTQVDLETESVFGVEALLRWDHPIEGCIAPGAFLPVAEESGLIVAIDDWVLHTACLQNKAWQDTGLAPMTMSVNVSGREFIRKDWTIRVAHALRSSGLAPEYLEIEIGEDAVMQNLDAALATMRQLQDMGVKLAIDDFGNSYASLRELKNYPNVRLKLDQSFIGELADRQDRGAIAQAVIRLGHELKFNVIAEGVEADTSLHFVRDNERREIQRYHDTPPVSADAIAAMLRVPRTVQATMQIDR